MPIGTVANYFEERGFGFIAPDDGGAQDFVHVSHIANADVLKKDQSVSFEIVTDVRSNKPRADRVRVLT
jgi:CspA family cold shock protein